MPSRAWVVTIAFVSSFVSSLCFNALTGLSCYAEKAIATENATLFQCPHGLELLRYVMQRLLILQSFNALTGLSCYLSGTVNQDIDVVSMPSRAWVVTARMSNILNSSWYFLCIPAIYRCILAYLPIFFNQLSKFLRCESPSTFLGTCLSHHSFIIFLVTNTNTLLSGLYLISTGWIFTSFL